MAAELPPTPGSRERALFLEALDRPDPAARAAFLDAACRDDAPLRARVEELLREQAVVEGFLETPALSGARPAAAARGPGGTEVVGAVTEKPGDRIGRYKLLQVIGEGGAGVVYMAEQEEPVRRRVALKVIKLGMDTKQVIARFEAERQALAMMDHPNIARVLDGGATETGRPFFVMELVRGVKITDYCDQHHLPAAERLKLFIQVCQAIQHAHQKGVIHRDIKPSNILVTLHDGVPVPKVIDFGIAKATEHRLTEKTLFTEFSMFIGTPAYMSPEQAQLSGLDIDTRSDIYSLGVLLYELLTGRTPFDAEALARAGLDQCRRTICEQEPPRPSTRLAALEPAELTTTAQQRHTEAPRLLHLLRGDLDWIAMKCLEKDRTRRYATASDLAQDIQRYLNGEPVLARPPSNLYRFQKFVRRHRGALAAAAGIAVTLLVGATISVWQAVRATRAERQAREAQKQELFLRQQTEEEWARAELEKAAARLNEYVADINLAQRSWADGNLGRAVQLLNKHRPAADEADLRGFEWRYLWQLCQGDPRTAFPKQDGPVHSLAVSPRGDRLAAGLWESCAIWDTRTHLLVTNLPKGAVSMAFFPDDRRLATASFRTVRIWRTDDWTELMVLSNAAAPLALSPDGARLAAASWEGVRVWDTATWNNPRFLRGAAGPMAFSPDGQRLVTETRDGLTVWSLDDSSGARVLQDSTNLFGGGKPWFRGDRVLAFTPDGRAVVAARNTLSARGVFVLSLWDATTGAEIGTVPEDPDHVEHTGAISALAFSPDGQTLATASLDHSIRLWDLNQRRRRATLQGHLAEAWAVAWSPDGRAVASAGRDGSLYWWPLGQPPKEDAPAEARQPLAFSKDGRILAALSHDDTVLFLNIATGEPEERFPLERRRGRFRPFGPAVLLSDDLRTLVVGADGGAVKLWNTESRETTTLNGGGGPMEPLALSPDGRFLITGGGFQAPRWWDLRASTNVLMETRARRLLFSPDGRTLAALAPENTVELWDTATRALRTNLVGQAQPGFAAAFSADSRFLAVVCSDDAIHLWDVGSARFLGVCAGHKQAVSSVAFSPDGRTLATASEDSTLKLWNVATRQELLTLRRLGGAVRDLVFSPDGRVLAGSGYATRARGLCFYRAPALSEIDPPKTPSERRPAPR